MAKQGKAPAVRRPPEGFETSTLLRSAEALGRMIGELQRQLDGATRRLARATPLKAGARVTDRNNGHGAVAANRREPPKTRKARAKKSSRRS